MARASMAALITQMRLLIGDPVSQSTFSDDELQTFLDGQRVDEYYAPLRPIPSVAAGGATSYLEWRAANGWYEDSVTLRDASYGTLTPDTEDLQRGVWTFAASQTSVRLSGSRYLVWQAAADAVDAWIAKVKFGYDFTADGATFKRSQMVESLTTLAAKLRASGPDGGVITAQMIRDDVTVY